jgi:16S rRNA (uracil1498-N3)-methyltransferase
MNITSRPFGPRQLARVWRRPSTCPAGRNRWPGGRSRRRAGSRRPCFSPPKRISPIIAPMNQPRFYCREALSPGAHVELPEPVARHAVRVLRLPPGAPVCCSTDVAASMRRASSASNAIAWCGAGRLAGCRARVAAGGDADPGAAGRRQDGFHDAEGGRTGRLAISCRSTAGAACCACPASGPPSGWRTGRAWRLRPASNAGATRCRWWRRWKSWKTGWPGRPMGCAAADAGARCRAGAGDLRAGGKSAVQLLIGAEGGLDPQESDRGPAGRLSGGAHGPRVLRTETAGLAALAAMQALWGDFRGG